jgi:hypothetical protein
LLKAAKPGSWAVVDWVLYLDAPAPGGKVVVETAIIGKNGASGDRLSLQVGPSAQGIGTALLNEYGEVVGIVGGSLMPGVGSVEAFRYGFPTNILGVRMIYRGAIVTPIDLLTLPSGDFPGTTLAELAQNGQFLPPPAKIF